MLWDADAAGQRPHFEYHCQCSTLNQNFCLYHLSWIVTVRRYFFSPNLLISVLFGSHFPILKEITGMKVRLRSYLFSNYCVLCWWLSNACSFINIWPSFDFSWVNYFTYSYPFYSVFIAKIFKCVRTEFYIVHLYIHHL